MRGILTRTLVWGLLGGAVLATAVGCSISGNSSLHRSGTCVEESAFARVELGKTTAEQVRGLLGDPNESKMRPDGVQVWTWRYAEKKQSSGEFLILHGSDDKDISQEACVELKDGIVIAKRRSCSTDQSHSG